MVYVLSSDKSKPTYREVFDTLKKSRPNLNPRLIVTDFELAAVNTARVAFPGSRIQGCNFHFNKNIIHQLGQKGLKTRYEKDIEFAHEIRMLMALAYVPVDQVVEAFEYFERNSKTLNPSAQENDSNVHDFMKYFVDHYIGRLKRNGGRGKPTFSLDLWKVNESAMNGMSLIGPIFFRLCCFLNQCINHSYCLNFVHIFFIDLPRTNNISEGWNNAFRGMVACHHPNIFTFMEYLQKENSISQLKIAKCMAGENPPKTKKKIYAQRNERVKAALEKFDKSQDTQTDKDTTNGNESDTSENDDDDNEEDDDDDDDDDAEEVSQYDSVQSNPFMQLLNCIADNTRL